MIGSAVEEDDKVVRGPRVLIEVDQHLQHDYQDDIGDDVDGDVDGDVVNKHLSPVEDGRAGLHLRDRVLGVEDVNDRHSAFRRIPKNCLRKYMYLYSKVKWISVLYFVSYLFWVLRLPTVVPCLLPCR